MGLPAISANGLPGNRVDAKRAGIMPRHVLVCIGVFLSKGKLLKKGNKYVLFLIMTEKVTVEGLFVSLKCLKKFKLSTSNQNLTGIFNIHFNYSYLCNLKISQ